MATPAVLWGTAFANTWTWYGPGDNPVATSTPRGSAGESQSGVRTFWETRTDEELEITARFIPRTTTGGVTGFASTNGVRDALAWMKTGSITAQNTVRFCPDGASPGTYHTCYLVADPVVEREPGG